MTIKKVFFYILAIVFSGCSLSRQSLSGYPDLIAAHSFNIDGSPYVPATVLARAYNLRWDWDPFAKTAVLRQGEKKIEFCVDSRLVRLGRHIETLDKPVRLYSGFVAVPLSFIDKALMITDAPLAADIPRGISRVVIDAGHGGADPGAVSQKGLDEKGINLDISRRLKEALKNYGFNVMMTREEDVFLSLSERVKMANAAAADLFISIHVNSAASDDALGFEAYYLSDSEDGNNENREVDQAKSLCFEKLSPELSRSICAPTLKDLVYSEYRQEGADLARYITRNLAAALSIRDRGIKSSNFYVLRGVCMPAVLVEVGFISNTIEESRLRNSFYRQMLAELIAESVFSFKTEYERSGGFVY